MAKRAPHARPEMPIAPMIDCVFLMLVYFMTTSSLERSETEQTLPFQGAGMAADPLQAVDEQSLHIEPGWVDWNGTRFSLTGPATNWVLLANRLTQFRETAERAGANPSVQIHPEPEATQQDLVTVLDAVRRAGIETVRLL